jgi:hypothetical protein
MIGLILGLAVVGLILYLVEKYIPMDPMIRTVIRVVVMVLVLLYLWRLFGLPDLPIPRYR